MKYCHVASGTDKILGKVIARQTGNCLHSIIGGFRSKDFGFHTILNESNRIREYIHQNLSPVAAKMYADSGGYSIIRGDIHPDDIPRLAKCYQAYFEHEREYYSYIFSLDIPFSVKYSGLNTRDRLYHLNKASLSDLRESLENHPELRDKVYFVWHFKMASQYDIWCKLYQELGLDQVVKHRAAGGMVGMRKTVNIHYSPFTPIAFRSLLDYLSTKDFDSEFRLHFLGMYIPYDRFQIALLEKLFKSYLGEVADLELTYDSINFSHTARMNNITSIFSMENGLLMEYKDLTELPDRLIGTVYGNDFDMQELFREEAFRKAQGRHLKNASFFAPLNIHSNLTLDRLFEQVIEEYEFVENIITSRTQSVLAGKSSKIYKDLKRRYGTIFTEPMIRSIRENLELTHIFHQWFQTKRDYETFQDLMAAFISLIGFPDMIR